MVRPVGIALAFRGDVLARRGDDAPARLAEPAHRRMADAAARAGQQEGLARLRHGRSLGKGGCPGKRSYWRFRPAAKGHKLWGAARPRQDGHPRDLRREADMSYHLEGRLLEVCNCRVLCPCWIGEDPDRGTCDTIVAWHFDRGSVNGVDVAGRTIACVAHVPGNILKGNWRAAIYVDDGATPQ